jgi:hypothetical protein
MKYEKLVEMSKASHIYWNGSLYWGYWEQKEEYTIFDYLSYQPAIIGIKFFHALDWLWQHRKRWIIATNKPKEMKT